MSSPLFEILKNFYETKIYSKKDLELFLLTNQIKEEEFKLITSDN